MIKLKNILNEHYWNERKFGEPLPKLRINEQPGVFKNKDADKYLKMLTTKVDKVYIVDESVKHSFPAEHRDYVYTTYTVPEWQQDEGKHNIDTELFKQFAGVTGSIIIDGLKGTVTARCGDLVANDITINFVLDVVRGKVEPKKEEYAKRILGDK